MNKNKLDNYMHGPDIINEPLPLREIHAIRLMIYDEIKDMTLEQREAYYRHGIQELSQRFNFRIVQNAKDFD